MQAISAPQGLSNSIMHAADQFSMHLNIYLVFMGLTYLLGGSHPNPVHQSDLDLREGQLTTFYLKQSARHLYLSQMAGLLCYWLDMQT